MIKGLIIKELEIFKDRRGTLTEIFRSDETDYDPKMSYISVTKPGFVRGPHEHKAQSDCFIFVGPGNFEVHLWDNRKISKSKGEYIQINAGKDNPKMIIIPPGIVHGYKCVSEVDGYSINLPDKLYKGKGKKDDVDEIRWENENDSKFQIF